MNTLIIPCAGKSSRFPNMKPKYLLTHPDGMLMIEKALSSLNTEIFDRIIITVVKYHEDRYEARLILEQVFSNNSKVEICMLDDFTSSASETICLTIEKMKIEGSIVIKDSDNAVGVKIPSNIKNIIVGYSLKNHPDISNIPGKSFIVINEQNIILDIIEKQVVSDIICLGVYCFEKVTDFICSYQEMRKKNIQGEMFVSHIISYMIAKKGVIFENNFANSYDDWGTLSEWKEVQYKLRTYFVDVDGVIMKNSGKYGKVNWYNNHEYLEENIKSLLKLQNNGAQIIITTSRPEECRKDLERLLFNVGLKPYAILMGLNHAARVIINDFAPTNPYPSGLAISLPRNSNIENYL